MNLADALKRETGRGIRYVARSRGFALAVLVTLALACSPNEDLTRAIDGGSGRVVSAALVPRATATDWTDIADMQPGNDTLVRDPTSACWNSDHLIVGDAAVQRILIFDDHGRFIHTVADAGDKAEEFPKNAVVRCSASRILVADDALERVSFADTAGHLIGVADAPPTPQKIQVLGDFAVADSGLWFDSWLGARIPLGPYLVGAAWDSVRLVRTWTAGGKLVNQFGKLVPYHNVVARRVLNRTFLLASRDTVWVLTQGDATVHAFRFDGQDTGVRIQLPIYYRGKEPSITIKEPLDSISDFRMNTFQYDPNVAGLAIVDDSLFATIRYNDWGYKRVGTGISISRLATSTVEVFSRDGRVLRAVTVPGMASELTTDGHNRVAVITRLNDRSQHILIGKLQ